MEKRMNLLSLTWPIFIENVLFMLLGFIDIFVLSRYNDIAASAVSAANQVISICNLVFSIISGATAILISQSLGAQKRQTASMIASFAGFQQYYRYCDFRADCPVPSSTAGCSGCTGSDSGIWL